MITSSFADMAYLSYLSDRPVGLTNDLLWKDAPIRRQILHIAHRIISPLYVDSTSRSDLISDSMTFAIYGRWGMGKSSALRMLKEAAVEAAAGEDGVGKDVSDQLKICDYTASAYAPFEMDARITLAQRMLTSLAGGKSEAITLLAPEAFSFGGNALSGENKLDTIAGATYTLQHMASTLSKLIDFDKIIQKSMKRSDGKPCVLLILIDDLDRCSTDYVWQILNFIQQLSDVPNLFFVLAVEQNHLRKTVEENSSYSSETPIDPDFALEKYIQHSIVVPDTSEADLKHFVTELMKNSQDDDDPAAVVSKVIIDNVRFLYGLRAMKGERALTPRSVKRCLNTIRPDLVYRLPTVSATRDQQKILKERILEYVWPSFYYTYFQPARLQDDWKSKLPMFEELEDACRDFAKETDVARLEFNLRRISLKYGPSWDSELDLVKTVPQSLAKYLGIPPFWFLKTDESEQEKFGEDLGLEDRFQSLYVRSEAAEAAGNRQESLSSAIQILNLIKNNRTRFNQRHAPAVGNIAINAERFGVNNLAEELYELALDLDRDHSHNIQNYVDFIVKAKMEHLYPRARKLIGELKTAKHKKYRPDSTLTLEARLNALTNEESSSDELIDPETVNRIVTDFLNDPSSRQTYISVMQLLDTLHEYDKMHELAKANYNAASSEHDRYLAIRNLADMLAASPDERNERKAMDMYRYMLQHFKSLEARADLPEMQHNFATLLYKHDYDDEAGKLWFEAYKVKPENMGIRRAYSLYLLRAGKPQLANLVAEGKSITEMALQPALKEIPVRFFEEDIDRWWEDNPQPAA
jgi:KAP family P-loop domain